MFVELEDGAKLVPEGRKTFYAYIYGQGPDAASVTATGGAVLYLSLIHISMLLEGEVAGQCPMGKEVTVQ